MDHIPLDQIDATAFPRDRGPADEAALAELFASISRDGLRTPIEVTPIEGERPFALLSGHRRLTVVRQLAELNAKWQTIPAFIRAPQDVATALRLIAEENAVREDISPWDQSRYAVDCVEQGHFETLDAAIAALYPSLSRQKRSRLRAVAEVVEHMAGVLSEPHRLSQQKLTRLAAAIRGDFADLMLTALMEQSDKSPAAQWKTLNAILMEAEAEAAGTLPTDSRPGHPIRYKRLRPSLRVRREWREDGWTLVFTGRDASGALMERVMEEVEGMVGEG